MSTPGRIADIRRVFLAKLDKIPQDIPEEIRVKLAKEQLDEAVPGWRDEVKAAGHGMNPTGGDDLEEATKDVGYMGDDVSSPIEIKEESCEACGGDGCKGCEEKGQDQVMDKLKEFFHGK
jgi:hypothetical protein